MEQERASRGGKKMEKSYIREGIFLDVRDIVSVGPALTVAYVGFTDLEAKPPGAQTNWVWAGGEYTTEQQLFRCKETLLSLLF